MRRITWMFGVLLGLSAVAAASPNLPFATVINQGDNIPGAGDEFLNASQVVAGPNGSVAISGLTLNNANPVIIYSTLSGSTWTSNAVAVAGNSYNIPPISSSEQFDFFDNLAVTGNGVSGAARLTFDAEDANINSGIIQWDTNNPSTLGDVAFDGDTNGYSSVGQSTDSGGSLLEMQVNGSGQALFPAISGSTSVLVRGDRSSVSTLFSSTGTISNAADSGSRVALGADNSAAALLTASGTPAIYSIPANAGSPTKISGSFTPSSAADPLMGYASSGGNSNALMLVNGTSSGTQNIVLEKNGSTPQSILAPLYQQFTIPAGEVPQGQLAPNGQIALFVPSTSGDTIQYANAATLTPLATVVAAIGTSVLDPTGSPNLKIISLTAPGGDIWGPEINSGGTIIFQAEIGTSSADEKEALMGWTPTSLAPEVLLAAGDSLNVGTNPLNNPVTIDDFSLNALSSEYDYYKNALNDQNGIAVAVDYTGPSSSGSAVLYAVVPEPSVMALLAVFGMGLLSRRKRH